MQHMRALYVLMYHIQYTLVVLSMGVEHQSNMYGVPVQFFLSPPVVLLLFISRFALVR